MRMRDFIRKNRGKIDEVIRLHLPPDVKINDKEREVWVRNDEMLYNWARLLGVKI